MPIISSPPWKNHNLLTAAEHTDSATGTVVRGDLIIGNSTPAWSKLIIGAANTVLWTDGTDPSWSAAPRLANIADTGGTNRLTTSTSSPQVAITGDVDVSGHAAFGSGASILTTRRPFRTRRTHGSGKRGSHQNRQSCRITPQPLRTTG